MRRGLNAAAQFAALRLSLNKTTVAQELWEMHASGVRGDIFNRWLITHAASLKMVKNMLASYHNHKPILSAFIGLTKLLKRMKNNGPVGVLTDGRQAGQQRKLKALGLDHTFNHVIYTDTMGQDFWKPDSRLLRSLAMELAGNPSHALYVADNPKKDFLAARRAGLKSLRVRHHYGLYAHLEPETPDHAPDWDLIGWDKWLQNGKDLNDILT
ncbi:conserved hypothetical protein [Desulfovibrionales bacterium]